MPFSEWNKIASDPEYLALSQQDRDLIRTDWFNQTIVPDKEYQALPEESRQLLYSDFNEQERAKETYATAPEDRGFFSSLGSHAARGSVEAINNLGNVAEMVDMTPRQIDSEEGVFDKIGRSVMDWSDKKLQESPLLRPDKREMRGDVGWLEKGVMGGVESIPQMAVPFIAGGAGLLASGGNPVAGAMAGSAGLVASFGLGQYGQTYKEAYDGIPKSHPGISEDERRGMAHRVALTDSVFEVGTEWVGDAAALMTFGGSEVFTQPLKATLKNMMKQPLKTFAMDFAKSAPFEVGGEMVAGGGQAWARSKEGLPGQTIGEGISDAIVPALTMTLLVGAGSSGLHKSQSTLMFQGLNAEDPDTRAKYALNMAQRIETNTGEKSLATTWLKGADAAIQKGEKFNFDEKLVDFASLKLAEDIDRERRVPEKDMFGNSIPDLSSSLKHVDILHAETVDDAIDRFKGSTQGLAQTPDARPTIGLLQGPGGQTIEAPSSQISAPGEENQIVVSFPEETVKAETKREKSLREYRALVDSLTPDQLETVKAFVDPEGNPSSPGMASLRIKESLKKNIGAIITPQPDIDAASTVPPAEGARTIADQPGVEEVTAPVPDVSQIKQPSNNNTESIQAITQEPVGNEAALSSTPSFAATPTMEKHGDMTASGPGDTIRPIPIPADIQSADLIRAAKDQKDTGTGRVGHIDWTLGSDGKTIEAAHAVTGRSWGTIDLETGDVIPSKPGREKELNAILQQVTQSAETSKDKFTAENLMNYPGRNQDTAISIAAKYPGQPWADKILSFFDFQQGGDTKGEVLKTGNLEGNQTTTPPAEPIPGGRIVPSGLHHTATFHNTDPSKFSGYGWRSMGKAEYDKLISGGKTYGGKAAGKGNFVAPTPDSAATYATKGKYLVEFGGVGKAEGETVSNQIGKENITNVKVFDGEKWISEKEYGQPKFKDPKQSKIVTLRGRLKAAGGINFLNFKGELKEMPFPVRVGIARKTGTPIDLIERTLQDEGWIDKNEKLLDILRDEKVLKRGKIVKSFDEGMDGDETDFQYRERKKTEQKESYDPEEPPPGDYVIMNAEDLPEGKKLTIVDGNGVDGWDEYEVIDKDPFGVTLKDGTIIELTPFEKVQVRVEDLEKEVPKYSVSTRIVSPSEYPTSLGIVHKHTTVSKLKSHPDYESAKRGGDAEAAEQVIHDLVKPEVLAEIKSKLDPNKPVYVVPVIHREGQSANMLPILYAARVAKEVGGEVWVGIGKVSGEALTDASAKTRVENEQLFDGNIPPSGSQVIVVDDTFTSGNTITSLIDKLSEAGNVPAAASTLASGRYQNWLAPTAEKRKALLDKAGINEVQFEHEFGYPTSHLTGSEIQQYILTGGKGLSGLRSRLPSGRSQSGPGKGQGSDGQASGRTEPQKTVAPKKHSFAPLSPKSGITIKDVRDMFPRQTVTEVKDGTFKIIGDNGKLIVKTVNHISIDEGAFEVSYRRKPTAEEIARGAAGSYQKGVIRISRIGDKFTLAHESFHHLIDSGLIRPLDVATLKRTLKGQSIDPTEEAMAKYVEDMRYKRDTVRGPISRVLKRIGDLIDGFVNLFTRTARGVVRDIESGKTQRTIPDGSRVTTEAPAYQTAADKWHSQMQQVLEKKLPGKSGAKQMAATIQVWANKGEFKPEELSWSGLNEWLKGQDGVVTKQEVLSWLAENNVRVEEVVKGEAGFDRRAKEKELEEEFLDEARRYDFSDGGWWYESIKEQKSIISDEIEATLREEENSEGDTEYVYAYDGKEKRFVYEPDADELLDAFGVDDEAAFDRIPSNEVEDGATQALKDHDFHDALDEAERDFFEGNDRPENSTKFSSYQTPGGEGYKELLLTLPERIKTESEAQKAYDNFWNRMSEKYGDESRTALILKFTNSENAERRKLGLAIPTKSEVYRSPHWGEPNVIAHVRFNERTGPNGERILFIDEVQSDWHQSGRKKGYKQTGLEQKNFVTWLKDNGKILPKEEMESQFKARQGEEIEAWQKEQDAAWANILAVPDAPFKKSWPMLAMKRMIRYVVENGFDSVGWTSGSVQAERYDLSKQVAHIDYRKRPEGYHVVAIGADIHQTLFDKSGLTESQVEDSVGKEVAQKIINGEGVETKGYGGFRRLAGLDLKVGSNGMVGFYDKILPTEVNKFFNKAAWGNAKVSQTDLGWELKITPEMKHKALYEGMPLYSVNPKDIHATRSELTNTALTLGEKLKAAVFVKPVTIGKKTDLSRIKDLILSTPQFFSGKIATVGRMYEIGQRKQDHMHELLDEISIHDGQNVVESLDKLKSDDKQQYKQVAEYLVGADKTGKGFRVELKDGAWGIIDPTGKEVGRHEQNITPSGVDAGEVAAIESMTNLEMESLRGSFTDQQIDVVTQFRIASNKVFEILIANLRNLQKLAIENEIAAPAIKISGTKSITIKEAIAQINSQRGTYFPRIREKGNFILVAEKAGEDSKLETFSTRFGSGLNLRRAALEKQGWTVTTKHSTSIGEDVFEIEGSAIKTQQIVNAALAKIKSGETEGIPQDIIDAFSTELSGQIANVIRQRGARAYMTQRSEKYYSGYEIDPSIAMSKYIVSIAGSESKRVMTGDLLKAFTGTDISWKEFQDVAEFEGTFEDYQAETPDRPAEITKEFFDKHNMPEALKQNEADLEEAHASLAGATDTQTIKALKEKIAGLRGLEYEEYQKVIKERRIDQGEQKNAFEWGKAFVEEMTRNTETADKIIGAVKSLAVVKYISTRVFASPFVNVMSLPTSAIATLKAAGIPYRDTWSHIGKGIKDYAKYRTKRGLTADAKEIYDIIHQEGWDNPQFSSEALSKLRGTIGRGYDAVIEKLMWTFSESERLNRSATISAAYYGLKKLHPAKSVRELANMAKKVSDSSHGVYNKGNYPFLAMGNNPAAQVAKMFYVFRTFAHTYYQNMARMGFNKEYGALAHMVISPAIVAGAGASVLMPLIKAILKGFGADDPEEDLYAWVEKAFGTGAGRLARHGIAGAATGVSLKGSMAVGILDVPTSIADLSGAPGSAIGDIFEGGKLLSRGDIKKGSEKMLPSGIGNIIRAYREYNEGVTNYNNAPVFFGRTQLKPTLFESVQRGMSFNPIRLAEAQEKLWSEKQIRQKYQERKSDIYSKVKRFYLQPVSKRSKENYAPIAMEIQEFNSDSERYDWMPKITSKTIKRYLKTNFRPSKLEKIREE